MLYAFFASFTVSLAVTFLSVFNLLSSWQTPPTNSSSKTYTQDLHKNYPIIHLYYIRGFFMRYFLLCFLLFNLNLFFAPKLYLGVHSLNKYAKICIPKHSLGTSKILFYFLHLPLP